MPTGAWRLGGERYPHCIRGVVSRDGGRDGSAAEPPNAARGSASELPGMELRLDSRALHDAIEVRRSFSRPIGWWPVAEIASPLLAFAWRS